MSLSNEKGSRRTEIRTKTDIPIKMKIANQRDWYEGRMVNLSRSGACIEGIPDFDRGTVIEVIVSLAATKKHYSIMAYIVWSDENRTGLRFLYAP